MLRQYLHASTSRDERGSVIETVLIAPVLMFVLMLIVQFALFAHARNVAEQAAQEGAAAARAFDGSADAGQAKAENFLAQIASESIKGQSVSVTRNAEEASVTVTGTVISLVPGMHLPVRETATGPVERYVPPEDNP